MPMSDGILMQLGVGWGVGVGEGVGLGVGGGVVVGLGVALGVGVGCAVGPGFAVGVDVSVGAGPPFWPCGVGFGRAWPDAAVVGLTELPAVPVELPDPEGANEERAVEAAPCDGTKSAPSTPPVARIPPPSVTASTTATTTRAAPAIDRRESIRRRTEATRTRGVTVRTTARSATAAYGRPQAGQAPTASAQHQRHE